MQKYTVAFLSFMIIPMTSFATGVSAVGGAAQPTTCNQTALGVDTGSVELEPEFTRNQYTCNAGYYLPADAIECTICPENSYCPGGTYTFSETTEDGRTACPNSWLSPAGMSVVAQCGRILHVGDYLLYLRSARQTTPSLNVEIDGTTFYGNMTTTSVPMHTGTTKQLVIPVDGTNRYVYDDTVSVN